MAMELLINSQTVEPFETPTVYRPIRKALRPAAAPLEPKVSQPSLRERFEKTACGRAILGCTRWGVIFALILSGYFGAELVSDGVDVVKAHTSGLTPQPVVASAETAR
jgi:hypothetical protein